MNIRGITSLPSLLWNHYPSTMTSLLSTMTSLPRYCDVITFYFDVSNSSTMTSLPLYYDVTTLYYDVTNPSTMTSLHLYYGVTSTSLLWRHYLHVVLIFEVSCCYRPRPRIRPAASFAIFCILFAFFCVKLIGVTSEGRGGGGKHNNNNIIT